MDTFNSLSQFGEDGSIPSTTKPWEKGWTNVEFHSQSSKRAKNIYDSVPAARLWGQWGRFDPMWGHQTLPHPFITNLTCHVSLGSFNCRPSSLGLAITSLDTTKNIYTLQYIAIFSMFKYIVQKFQCSVHGFSISFASLTARRSVA
jgi:hypothetical protein